MSKGDLRTSICAFLENFTTEPLLVKDILARLTSWDPGVFTSLTRKQLVGILEDKSTGICNLNGKYYLSKSSRKTEEVAPVKAVKKEAVKYPQLRQNILAIFEEADRELKVKEIREKLNKKYPGLDNTTVVAVLEDKSRPDICNYLGTYMLTSKKDKFISVRKSSAKSVQAASPAAVTPVTTTNSVATVHPVATTNSVATTANPTSVKPVARITATLESVVAPATVPLNVDTSDTDEAKHASIGMDTYFLGSASTHLKKQRVFLASEAYATATWPDRALLGADALNKKVYFNTHEPFCLVAVGLQGSGKSHSMGCVLESCLLPLPGYVTLSKPMNALVLHYDKSDSNVCEAIGLAEPSGHLTSFLHDLSSTTDPTSPSTNSDSLTSLPREKVTIFVSPSYFLQRQKFYANKGYDVRPLLFRWDELTADHIKLLMAVQDSDSQLYMVVLMDMLRQYQSANRLPSFCDFISEIKGNKDLSGQQQCPLTQRLKLLESFVFDSLKTQEKEWFPAVQASWSSISEACGSGRLVIVDLSDPLLSHPEANTIFQVVVEQYRTISPANPADRYGKLLVVDEAHKFMNGKASDGLSAAIVNIARLVRHDGIRLAVSTQDPQALAPELLELTSVALLHHFRSKEWFDHVAAKLALAPGAYKAILDMQEAGRAIVAVDKQELEPDGGKAAAGDETHGGDLGHNVFSMKIRQRFTSDYGSTRANL